MAKWSSVVLLGLAALAVSLVVSLPVSLVAERLGLAGSVDGMSGTVWNGTAARSGFEARWQVSALQSLRGMRLVVNWRLTGPGTDLAGPLALKLPSLRKNADLGPVSGIAGWGLVEALMPGLPIRCDGQVTVAGLRLVLTAEVRTAGGGAVAAPATCTRIDGAVPPVATPPLALTLSGHADGIEAVLSDDGPESTQYAVARLTEADRVIVTIRAVGAAQVPGMPSEADSEIDLPLSALLP